MEYMEHDNDKADMHEEKATPVATKRLKIQLCVNKSSSKGLDQ